MTEVLIALGVIGFLLAVVAIICLFILRSQIDEKASYKFSRELVDEAKEEILGAMLVSLEEAKEAIANEAVASFPNMNTFNSTVNSVKDELKGSIKTAVEAEKGERETSEGNLFRELSTKIETDVVNGIRKITEEVKGASEEKIKALDEKASKIEKTIEELKVVIKDGDQKTYNDLASSLDAKVQKEVEKFKKGLDDFKTEMSQKSEDLRRAMGHLYPHEALAEKLSIELGIAQKLIDLGLDVKKIAEMEAITFAVNVTGVVELPEAVKIHTKAKEVASIQETVVEVKEAEITDLTQKLEGAMGNNDNDKEEK